MELVRRPSQAIEIPARELPADELLPDELLTDDLLAAARSRSHRLYLALATVLSFNLAVVSGALTFWALALH